MVPRNEIFLFAGREEWAHLGLKSAEANRPGFTWDDFRPLLQGLLVDAEGSPISLSATGFHAVVGQIRDKLAGSEALRELVVVLLQELEGR